MKKPKKYTYGYPFEEVCAGFSSFGISGYHLRQKDFPVAFGNSVATALQRGSDERQLREKRAFFYRLYIEVRQALPKRLRKYLKVLTTLGTEMDVSFGGDFIFFLNDSFVTVDITAVNVEFDAGSAFLKKYNRQKKNPWSLIFLRSDMDEFASTVAFARRIAQKLMDRESDVLVKRFNLDPKVISNICSTVYTPPQVSYH